MQKYPKMVKNGQKWLFFWCFYEDEAKSFCDYLRLDFSSKNRKKTQKTRKNGPLAQGRGRIFVFFLALNARKKNPKKEVFFCCSFNQPLIRRAPPRPCRGFGVGGVPLPGGPPRGGRGWALLRVLLANCIFCSFLGRDGSAAPEHRFIGGALHSGSAMGRYVFVNISRWQS